jgi:siroheme decarboxylase
MLLWTGRIDTMERVLKTIPQDFPISERPYKEMADRMGISESELIEALSDLKERGVVRRVAAALHHRKASYTHNAMVVWRVEEEEIERVGRTMSSFSEVSHCYERDRGGYWDYTVYTMIHGMSRENCMEIVKRISLQSGISDYQVFFSKREFKKVSLTVNVR